MHYLIQYRQVRLTRLTPLDAPEVVGDIQIPTEQMTYLLNDALVHNCSFCKESLLARGFTQMDFEEGTGIIRIRTDEREPFEVPSKARVKFYDTNQERIVIGPLSAAVANAFPIATDSLEKLRAGELYRVLAD